MANALPPIAMAEAADLAALLAVVEAAEGAPDLAARAMQEMGRA